MVMGRKFSEAEAKHRIMQWCINGLRCTDREMHMTERPRFYTAEDLEPVDDLIAQAARA